ncbi:GUN4 N-terminal ARM-like repeat domain-containing protein [Leptolyngbya sp. FACHB-671]|uniref:GUN4 domain-containing protein n=1 Tax=Leptolyngbya sp. FACHB-671 TaxID=2692812 RepID=UPI001685A9F6|nr:GUN4 domain-containing protein [Leptolyngbya sp. FACHB-671]MBD2072033.1 GUN4 N-terminal ARM-like repeat domain-containing protein [Leptolyngbya sp. FACHB-671]
MSRSTTDPTSAPLPGSDLVTDLRRLNTESEKTQLQLVQQLADSGDSGLETLMEFLLERSQQPSATVGKAYRLLRTADTAKAKEFCQTHFPQGVVPLQSAQAIDYSPLQDLLIRQDFQAADRLTLEKLCELAGETAIQRKWIYFTEVDGFPAVDLKTINSLWLVYSEGKFGYSVQRELWLGTGKNWEKLWPMIGWKSGNNWTRYPQEFTWDLSAPKGHLPLSNQLRGVRVIAAMLMHPAWTEK